VIHAFFGLLGGVLLLFGILKFRSAVGAAIALAYITITFVCALLSQRFGHSQSGIIEALTLPWSLILPCYNLDRSCPLSLGVAFICAELNAAVLYFLVVLGSRLKDEW
jgi:hypothetical protein